MSGVAIPNAVSCHGSAEASAYGGKEMRDPGLGENVLASNTVGSPYTRYEEYASNQCDLSNSWPVGYDSGEAGYVVQQSLPDDVQCVGGGRRLSEYSESDYGSTRRRSWGEWLESGGQEVMPLRVEKKTV